MKKRIIIPVVIVLAFVLILFLPVPRGTYDDGTREYAALTYKIVVWNKIMAVEDKNGEFSTYTYRNTSVFWFPDNQKSIDELWQIEKANSEK